MTPRRTLTHSTPTESQTHTSDTQEQIRQRAYQLFEEHGRQDGFAEQDWLQAETEVMGKALKAAA